MNPCTKEELLNLNNKLTEYPVNLILELTTRCELKCSMCPREGMIRDKSSTMSSELVYKIIEEIGENSPKDTKLWFAFMGEPALEYERLANAIMYSNVCGIKNTIVNTNGWGIFGKCRDIILASKPTEIIVSLDAFYSQTYLRKRNTDNMDKLYTNVERLIEKSGDTKITVQFIETDDDIAGESELFKKYWINKGAFVKIRRKLGWGDSVESKCLTIPQKERHIPCPWLMRQMVILNNGIVSQCDADYDGIYCAGDINNCSIKEAWQGELLYRRKRHMDGDFNFKPCSTCNDWQVGKSEIWNP